MGSNFIDITGQKFNRWTVIKRVANNRRNHTMWLCICDCGKEKVVDGSHLKSGRSKSCGCLKREQSAELLRKYNFRNMRLYGIWLGFKKRCFNPNHQDYADYGARGITVCEEWKNDYKNFQDWALANGYNDTLSIDRIDVNGNYEPANCRWATDLEQANNKRNNRYITYNGETHTITEWAQITGLSRRLIEQRIYVSKWSPEKAVSTPLNYQKSHPQKPQ